MKKIAFACDFDVIVTDRHFNNIVMDPFLQGWGRHLYEDWKITKKINIEFLNKILGYMESTEADILAEIHSIPVDEDAIKMIHRLQKAGGKFYILSAGIAYYIDLLLEHLQMEDVKVISMNGIYKNGSIEMIPDEKSPYSSGVFGINKGKIIKDLKMDFDIVFFAGDGEPDLGAVREADFAFVKKDLKQLLASEQLKCIHFEKFSEIEMYLEARGWLG